MILRYRPLFSRVAGHGSRARSPFGVMAFALALALGSVPAMAAVFTVNSTADVADANTHDGICNDGAGHCTLRAAIQQADASGGANTVNVPAGSYRLGIADLTVANATGDLTVVGTGAAGTTVIDGQGALRIFNLHGGAVVLINLVIQNGRVTVGSGGAGACLGAGILVYGAATVRVDSSVIQNNAADNGSGSGICVMSGAVNMTRTTVRNNASTYGGSGLRIQDGTLVVSNSTFSGNTASKPSASGAAIESQATVEVVNSTFSGNALAGRGSAIAVLAGTTTLRNVSIAGNGAGPQLSASPGSSVVLESTILADPNGGTNCDVFSGGSIVSHGHNLDSAHSCGFAAAGDLVDRNPLLEALQDRGGLTAIHALGGGSPAVDAGSNAVGGSFDQRGTPFARVVGAAADIGAYEQAVVPSGGFQGLFWRSPAGSESGWGINFAHQGELVFATWFTYGADGKPLWLAAVLQQGLRGVFAGDVFTTTALPFDALPWDKPATETTVGTMTAAFSDADNGVLTTTVYGVTQTKPITRQLFGAAPVCIWGGQPNLALATNYQDLWWNAGEAGWGVNFTHQDDIVFATWFTYDGQGKPWWLIAVLAKSATGVYAGPVSTVGGPPFNSVPWGAVAETEIGSATATFANGNSATFAYTVNGVSQTKAITRQVFAAPGTVCH